MTSLQNRITTFFSFFFLSQWIAAADQRPNFILCMGDDHGWSETGYNGHPHVKTPVLDEMAANGLRLDRFYAAHPSCSPTRGSFLTGRHPNRFGTFKPGWSIRPEEITMAKLLGQAGYRCGHFGKWHLGPVKAESPTNPGAMGFHEWVSHDNFYEMNPEFSRNGGPPEKLNGEGSEVTIVETIAFIDRCRDQKKPFLAVVWFGSPHEPYSGLQKDLDLYNDLPAEYAKREVRLTSMETGRQTNRPLRDVLRERYAEITAMDRSLGQLRDYLESAGLRENTLVFYCGDNGNPPSSGRTATPLRGQKATLFEGGIRVPGVAEWPGQIPPGEVSALNATTSDLLPTICGLLKIPLPKRPFDGINLAPLVESGAEKRPDPLCFWEYDTKLITGKKEKLRPYIDPALQEGTTPLVKYLGGKLTRSFTNFHQPEVTGDDYGGSQAIIDGNHKLIVRRGKKTVLELYHLGSDPAEEINLADEEPALAEKLRQRLREWQSSVLESLQGKDY